MVLVGLVFVCLVSVCLFEFTKKQHVAEINLKILVRVEGKKGFGRVGERRIEK